MRDDDLQFSLEKVPHGTLRAPTKVSPGPGGRCSTRGLQRTPATWGVSGPCGKALVGPWHRLPVGRYGGVDGQGKTKGWLTPVHHFS